MSNLYDNIPDDLKALKQWVCWALVNRGEKLTKLPINARTGGMASATDPATAAIGVMKAGRKE